MTLKTQIDPLKIPKHVAVIMDGNGRWAKQKGMARVFGHRNGVKAVRDVVESAAEIGVKCLNALRIFYRKLESPQERSRYLNESFSEFFKR